MVSNCWAYLIYCILYISSIKWFLSVKISIVESQKFKLSSETSVLYQESEKWHNLFFDLSPSLCEKGVVCLFPLFSSHKTKSLQENYHFERSYATITNLIFHDAQSQHRNIQQRLHSWNQEKCDAVQYVKSQHASM